MAYATVTDFKDAFPDNESVQLTNLDDPTATAEEDARITEALNRASSEIDSYVGILISLPLAAVPLVLKVKVLDIARYLLDSYDPRSDVRQRYEDAIAWLKLVAEGKVSLGVASTGAEVTPDAALPTVTASDRVFTADTMYGY